MERDSSAKYRKIGILSYSIALVATLLFLIAAVALDQWKPGAAWEKGLSVFFGVLCAVVAIALFGLPLRSFWIAKPGDLSGIKVAGLFVPLVISVSIAVIVSLLDYFNL